MLIFFILAVLLSTSIVSTVSACSPVAVGIHLGKVWSIAENQDTLLTRIDENPSLVPGCFRGGGFSSTQALINLKTGILRPVGTDSVTVIPRPIGIRNPTRGYHVELGTRINEGTNIQTASLVRNGSVLASFDIPAGYSYRGTYFVSYKLQMAYVLMEDVGDRCRSEHNVLVAIVALDENSSSPSAANVSFSHTRVSESQLPLGFDCDVTEAGEEGSTLYDDIQVYVHLAPSSSRSFCLASTYIFFNETGINYVTQSNIFQSWDLLESVVYHPVDRDGNINDSNIANYHGAFLVRHEYGSSICPSGDGCYTICPDVYSLREVRLSTSEILRTVPLNSSDIVSILYGNYTPPSPTDRPNSITAEPSASPSPTHESNSITAEPSAAPAPAPNLTNSIVGVAFFCFLLELSASL